VGLDPILRDNVWKFLTNCVNNSGKTVILTTHYMNEARFCSKIGFIRDGSMLVEDCPMNIQNNLNTSDLDDALLMLCEGGNYEGPCEPENFTQEINFFDKHYQSGSGLGLQRLKALISEDIYFIRTRFA
jgi:ABC-type multidrug transport system ATPase subunit